jgi:hypothetical protein
VSLAMRKFVSEEAPGLVWVLLAFLLIDGASTLWAGGEQLQPARELSRSGRVVTATESLVYLRVDRGGLALRQVRVRTDIRPELVYLSDVQDRTDSTISTNRHPLAGNQPLPLPATRHRSRSATAAIRTAASSPWQATTSQAKVRMNRSLKDSQRSHSV